MLEVALMIASHVRSLLQVHYALSGCMMIAGTASLLYARALARGYGMGALGGLVIGAACVLAAVAAANLLGDQPERYITLWRDDRCPGRRHRRTVRTICGVDT